jgi:hypothetical protein
MSSYVKQFLSLRAAGDILNALSPFNNVEKEITEAVAIRQRLRAITLKEPMKYTVYDLCAGNCLAGVLSVFTLPVKFCYALDKRTKEQAQKAGWPSIQRWEYFSQDILNIVLGTNAVSAKDSILISSHPCKELASQIVKLYNSSSRAKALIMIPCCVGESSQPRYSLFQQRGMKSYDFWCLKLADQCVGKVSCFQDINILSPANIVIEALKTEEV